ncbi:MAG TPA: hypothetical protein VFR68_01105 [Candidatus Dormibacteraeota bacterium]|nr:hypothetical protein [Candidatus Dormibacteraeota bacterium]
MVDPSAVAAHGNRDALVKLGHAYKQLDATVGAFGTAVVNADTRAVATGQGSQDGAYRAFESWLNSLTDDRNSVALQISQLVEATG